MAPEHPIPRKLWENPNPKSSQMWKFMESLGKAYGTRFPVGSELILSR
jgi:acetoacetyl-CoA synthetase